MFPQGLGGYSSIQEGPNIRSTTAQKYGRLQFYDINMKKMFYTDAKKLNWTRPYRDQSGGYSVVC
jgi:hypothetical protein